MYDIFYVVGSFILFCFITFIIIYFIKKHRYKKFIKEQAQFEIDVENAKKKILNKKNNAKK